MNDLLKRFIGLKIRKRRRYRPVHVLYAIVENSGVKNQVDDISLGGLSFYFIDNGFRPKKNSYTIKLYGRNSPEYVEVACKTISESETGELVFQNKKIKRRSVKFERLNSQQKEKLKRLIAEI
jgi:c-di-GMP-binding flagellar brake protein YcgR